jgi:hypothetical protein
MPYGTPPRAQRRRRRDVAWPCCHHAAASIGFNVLALAIQYERLVSRAALQRRREAPRDA